MDTKTAICDEFAEVIWCVVVLEMCKNPPGQLQPGRLLARARTSPAFIDSCRRSSDRRCSIVFEVDPIVMPLALHHDPRPSEARFEIRGRGNTICPSLTDPRALLQLHE